MDYEEVEKIWKKIRALKFPDEDAGADGLRKFAEEFRREAGNFDRALDGPTSGIETFFQTVGNGVVDAQKTLDGLTLDYLQTKPALPTAYRIPKVSAEIQFSALERTSGGFFARIFTDTKDQEQSTKNKVTFDIVAAPPPPELIQQINLSWMSAFIVTDLPTRRRLFEAAKRFRDRQKADLRTRAEYVCNQFNRTVIVQSGSIYAILLFYKNEQKKTVLEILRIGAPDAEDPNQDENFLIDNAEPKPELKELIRLYESFMPFLDVQEARLKQLESVSPNP